MNKPLKNKEMLTRSITPSSVKERPNIVIIDDDELVEVVLRDALNGIGNLFFATTAQAGLSQINQHQPSLILLDIGLPDGDGLALCQQIKDDPQYQITPVIFITSRESVEVEENALIAGGIDFLQKPINTSIWRQRSHQPLSLVPILSRARDWQTRYGTHSFSLAGERHLLGW